ncbi:amidohydrolase family protein [Streptomyces sp. NPDC055210]
MTAVTQYGDNAPDRPAALLVSGGTVYTADPQARIHAPGSVLVVDGGIAAVGGRAEVDEAVARLDPRTRAGLRTLDAGAMMVLPGLVNPHWHEVFAMRLPYKGALRSPSDRDDDPGFMARGGDMYQISAMFDSMHRLALRLTPDESEAIATYSMWTQLRSGTTTLGDIGSVCRPESMVAATRAVGMRAVVSAWTTDGVCVPGEEGLRRTWDADEELARIEDVLKTCGDDPTGRVRAMPSAVLPVNMSDELGRGLAALAERYDTPLGTHVGALRTEAQVTRAHFGTTPLRRLDRLGLLTDRLIAAHLAFADREEHASFVAARGHVSHSPAKYGSTGESTLTETRMITELWRQGVDVSLSTDGMALPIGGMTEAMRAAWQIHNEMTADPTTVLPTDALAMATRTAARGLRWADAIGSLEPGKRGDLVLVRTDDWRYLLNPRPLEAYLTMGGSADVDTVVVDGRVHVEGGRATHLDEARMRQRYLEALGSFSGRELGIKDETLRQILDAR